MIMFHKFPSFSHLHTHVHHGIDSKTNNNLQKKNPYNSSTQIGFADFGQMGLTHVPKFPWYAFPLNIRFIRCPYKYFYI